MIPKLKTFLQHWRIRNMNNRIKELIKVVGTDVSGKWMNVDNAEKFAELIVKECAEIVRIQNEQFMENESHYVVVSTDVLKHFGIEE